MISYFRVGQRDYYKQPAQPSRPRPMWEFQAVIDGKIARAHHSEDSDIEFFGKSLWVSPPGSKHGWRGQKSRPARIIVFHFRTIPKILEDLVFRRGHLRIDLSTKDEERLRLLAEKVRERSSRFSPEMLLLAEAAVSELSLLAYERSAENSPGPGSDGYKRVEEALRFYETQMKWNPSLDIIAAKVNISVAHLRRLFHENLGSSPKAIFEQLRERRILQLMTDRHCTLEFIAEETGYSESSALSRSFKAKYGYPPSIMRVPLPEVISTEKQKGKSKKI